MSPRRRLARVFTGSVVVVVAATAALGLAAAAGLWAARHDAAPRSRIESSTRASALGPVRVSTPAEWRPLPTRASGFRRIAAQPTLVFEPAPGLLARAVLTIAPLDSTDSASLVPQPMREAAARPLELPRAVRLDGRAAWLYSAVPVGAGETMDVTVLPTTGGVVAIACRAPKLASAAAAGCASGVRLDLHRAPPLRPTGDLGFRLRLGGVARRLDQQRVVHRARLQQARRPRAQARAARRLAGAHAQAARALAPFARSGAAARAVALLHASSRAYDRLSRSATAGDGAAFRRAARSIDAVDGRLRSTYEAFSSRAPA